MSQTLFYNARFYLASSSSSITSDDKKSYAYARYCIVDQHTGAFTEFGAESPSEDFIRNFETQRAGNQVVDLQGQVVYPGFHDAHIHMYFLGQRLMSLDCSNCSSIEELTDRLKKFAADHPDLPWITGAGWDQEQMGRYPTKLDLDAVETTRPVVLQRACYHICVCNSNALEKFDIHSETPDPSGGKIDRLPNSTEPSGILREHALEKAYAMIEASWSTENRLNFLRASIRECVEHGITAVQTNDRDCWLLYKQLLDSEELPIRIFLTINYDETNDVSEKKNVDSVPAPGDKYKELLSCDRVKMFADGSLGAETAALSEPYIEEEHEVQAKCNHNCGILLHSPEELKNMVKDASEKGYRIEMHAIGDLAAQVALDAFENAENLLKQRPVLTHCQVLRKDLIDRMVKLNVIADVQPQFVVTDSLWALKRLGPARMKFSYAWKTLLEAGIVVAGGSDAPVEKPIPTEGIHAAIFRPKAMPKGILAQRSTRRYRMFVF